ncbi:phage Gp19/Gp15/Gp42 family protein [Erysipelatoclostridium ramosum]|nr:MULTISPECIES: phage Gp19/Gp15/Gp42 family protein [Thomasclavelia]MCB5437397.1 phage Gp19/Gp15/Gp42 family protein [Thomasclavelia ramosa]MCB5454439.1 phage Gp19/Gp15/Gp42 family protein [Thomasclavelia ramosa]MCB5511916.1 phage Gp19/Gp15/Gp42 family protein [Thomasclavelia ramosa]MCB5610314.1 phage Gp19/Gp15/Gp42 family protein [Thomasclavelia ramosa]MCB5638483.1 phage Gp19/Gp15/Gp42 family protein [Thomasclavelia ramosa]
MKPFVTLKDISLLFRDLSSLEERKASALLEVVSDSLRQEAKKVGKNLDEMIKNGEVYENVVKSVAVDIIARNLMTSTDSEPMEQFSQSALGYTASGTYLVPGGGLFIKKSELSRLGLRRQRIGVLDIWGLKE